LEVLLKTIIAALAGASLLALAAPAAAQSHGGGWGHGSSNGGTGGGWTHGSSGGAPSGSGRQGAPGASGASPRGGFQHGGFAGGRAFDGDHFHHHFHGFPVFLGGFGFGLGLAAFDPWFFDGPYYGSWEPYPYYAYGAPYGPPPPAYYYPPTRAESAPPGPAAAPPPAACGSWAWDSAKQAYNWVPCGA
jgi:hypothetical protein